MLAPLLLAAVTAERLLELGLAHRNTRALLARGAHEVAPRHYPAIVGLHAAWLASLWIFGSAATVQPGWLVAFLVLQVLRAWVLVSLGARWTTRIIILPHAPLVRRGPYRYFSHPNYAVVVGEIATLPMALRLPIVAGIFTLLNLAVLAIRIRAENRGLMGNA